MPSSQAPTPSQGPVHKKSSGAPFIAAVLVMLLLMGGLIYWKTSSGSTQPVAPAVVSAQPEQPKLEEAPPPPPVPEEPAPSASVDSKTKIGKKGAVTATGPCAGECEGTAPGALQSALAGLGGRSRRCYERALLQNPNLQGKLMSAVRVGPTGEVCSANIASNQLGDPGIASCVVGIFRGAQLPAPKNGCVDTQVPLNFVPKQ